MISNTRALANVCFLGPVNFSVILIDRYLLRSGNPFLGIPRTIPELFTPAERIFNLLREHNSIPSEARFISCDHLGGAETEPDKNVAYLEMVYSLPVSGSKKIKLFIKLPTARKWSAIAKAIIATISDDMKEVAFYNDVFPELSRQAGGKENLGFTVPKNLFSTWSRYFDRSILIQECVDMDRYHSRPDWMNADIKLVQNIVGSVTDLHRRTWQLRNVPPNVVSKYKETGGVDWLDAGLKVILVAAPKSFQKMWKAIKKRTAMEPATISHGDCRLGNCLITADYSEVILTDWEVNSITYYLWDISYCMICSLTPEDRRQHEEGIIRHYLKSIAENSANIDIPSFEKAMELHRISFIVVNFFGGLIAAFGGVGETQGNSNNDIESWDEKCGAAMLDALKDQQVLAKALDIDVSLVSQFREDYLAYAVLSSDMIEKPGLLAHFGRQAFRSIKSL